MHHLCQFYVTRTNSFCVFVCKHTEMAKTRQPTRSPVALITGFIYHGEGHHSSQARDREVRSHTTHADNNDNTKRLASHTGWGEDAWATRACLGQEKKRTRNRVRRDTGICVSKGCRRLPSVPSPVRTISTINYSMFSRVYTFFPFP